MKSIPLSKGYFALVDDADYPELIKHKWCVARCKAGKWYAVRNSVAAFKRRTRVYMHRQLLGNQLSSLCQVDHVNGNGLDNQRSNLRTCNSAQNQHNVGRSCRNASGFKGVSWNKLRKAWVTHIQVKGKAIFGGYHASKEHAAQVHDRLAIKHHGPFAYTNYPRELYDH